MNKIKIQEDSVYNKYVKKDIKIIHMADIHFNINTKDKTLKSLENCIDKEKPNYVIITGDIIDSGEITRNKEKIEELVIFFKNVAKNNKIIMSLGNHDIRVDVKEFFNKLSKIKNIYVLDNDIYQDEWVYVSGFTLPSIYFYNKTGDELVNTFVSFLDDHLYLIDNIPKNKINIALIHSPIKVVEDEILSKLSGYDMILSGHTHDGLVPDIIKFFYKGNRGIVSPYRKLFPKIAKGRVDLKFKNKNIVLIITGGVTKLSLKSAKWLSKFNSVYNISVNRIIIKEKRYNYE